MKKLKILNYISLAAFTVLSGSVLLTPLSINYDVTNGKKFISYIIMVAFWGGLLVGLISEIAATKTRKNCKIKVDGKLPGILSSFKNKESTVAICLFFIGLITAIIFRFIDIPNKEIFQIIGMFAAMWGFCLHCVFDGLNYRAVKNNKECKTEEEK